MNKQQLVSGNWVDSTEELHYRFDSNGKIINAAFAQTPIATSAPYLGAASRAQAIYDYLPTGQLADLKHIWEVENSGSPGLNYNLSKVLLRNAATYNDYTGLKEHNYCYEADSGTPTNWGTARQENFGYDVLNQLTLANYGNGGGNHTWSYDAAANRSDATTVDNLNRATVIGGVNRAYDILGNTTSIGTTKSMTWDVLNRMTSMTNGSITWDYTYRADGMRVQKQRVGQTDYNTYRYDGQMPIEDYTDATTYPRNTVYLTKYGLGARGIDYIERLVYNPASTLVGFPVYDAHGNMIATLMRGSSNTCTLNDMRAYDAWGGVRSGATTGDPAPRHSANLGHVQDDESGLVYMRARYYDAGSGRFVSEDPARDGANWFVYCDNSPINRVDSSGNSSEALTFLVGVFCFITGLLMMGIGYNIQDPSGILKAVQECTQLASMMRGAAKKKDFNQQFFDWLEDFKGSRNSLNRSLSKTSRGAKLLKGGAATTLIGAGLILKALLFDIDLEGSGFDILQTMYGGG